ncbi:Thioredoxin-like 4A [Podila horticola]|nr:Thioredoxin-like 4A [Podila horticola]
MSSFLPHLKTSSAVDRAIQSEHDRVVILRFGIDWHPDCRRMDELLSSITGNIKNFAVVYLVDITEVPDFNTIYELYDPCTVMFFFRNKHILVDLGTGKITQINWVFESKRELIDIIETVFRGLVKAVAWSCPPRTTHLDQVTTT